MNKTKRILFFLVWGLMPLSLSAQTAQQQEGKDTRKETTADLKVTEGRVTETKLIPLTDRDSVWKLAFYGFVKADYIYATDSVVSYGRENLQAANQAKRQVQRDDYQSRQNIQLQDSRLGFRSKYNNKLTGVIELDFIDFDKSSPNVNVRPRLRQAYVEWDATENFQFFAGQKWDIFSPLNPDTYNVINNLLYLGNVGWMREQFGIAYKLIPELKASVAVGNTAVNTAASPSLVEKNPSPTVSGQIKWTPNKENTVYLSGITVRKKYFDPDTEPARAAGKALFYDGNSDSFALTGELGKSPKINRQATGISVGSQYKPEGGRFSLKWEGNWGRNLSDLNTLGIGQAQITTADHRFLFSETGILTQSRPDGLLNPANPASLRAYNKNRTEVLTIEEVGAWFSLGYLFDPKWEAVLFAGITEIVNNRDLTPALITDAQGTRLRDFSVSQPDPSNGIWTPNLIGRMRENGTIGYSITYFAETGLKLFFQHEYIQTFYQDAIRTRGILAHIKSLDLDTGQVTLQNVTPPYLMASAKATAHMFRFGTMYNF